MYIFIAAVVLVSFIALCFFKKRFWENRYLVLFISGCVALVATLTTNYATRGKLDTKVTTVSEIPIQVMSLNTALMDSTFFTTDNELGRDDHLISADTTGKSVYSRHLFYYNSDDELCVGFGYNYKTNGKLWKTIYILPSETDTTAYFAKKRLDYNPKPNKWVADFSLPSIQTIKCLYLPPTEYALIPDSLIRELPFKL